MTSFPFTVGSLFAGIGGFELGLERTGGFETVWQVECDKHAQRVLTKHWPDVPRYEDVREFVLAENPVRPGLICGGFPCQDLSLAGRRAGLAGEQSGLFYEFMRIVAERIPHWVLVENVPGLLSSNGGRDMATVLGTLWKLGYGTAYRILDAQWFGVAQRRRRVFIVGCFGGAWRRAAEVLFESESLPWNPPPRRKAGTRIAASLTRGSASGSRINAPGRRQEDDVNIVVGTLQAHSKVHGHAATTQQAAESEQIPDTARCVTTCGGQRMAGHEDTLIPFDTTQITRPGGSGGPKPGDPCHTLAAGAHPPSVAYQPFVFESRIGRNDRGQPSDQVNTPKGSEAGDTSDMRPCVMQPIPLQEVGGHESMNQGGIGIGESDVMYTLLASRQHGVGLFSAVRRLTPRECERLQGFPDDWTRWGAEGEELSDSPRYRILGNAVCVNVAEWIGHRILAVNEFT